MKRRIPLLVQLPYTTLNLAFHLNLITTLTPASLKPANKARRKGVYFAFTSFKVKMLTLSHVAAGECAEINKNIDVPFKEKQVAGNKARHSIRIKAISGAVNTS